MGGFRKETRSGGDAHRSCRQRSNSRCTRANVGTVLLDNNAIRDLRCLAEFFELNTLGAELESTLQETKMQMRIAAGYYYKEAIELCTLSLVGGINICNVLQYIFSTSPGMHAERSEHKCKKE